MSMMATRAPRTTPAIAPFEKFVLGLSGSSDEVEDDVFSDDVEVAESWIRSAAYTDTFAGTV